MSEIDEKPTFNELERYTMFTASPGVENRRAKLAWVEYNGNLRVSVSPNNPNDKSQLSINAAMDPVTFEFFLSQFETICNGPNGAKDKIPCKRGEVVDGKTTGKKFLLSDLFFGKDDEGKCWISVKTEDRPEIMFYFAMSDYHEYKSSRGPVSEADMSKMIALATIRCLRTVMIPLTNKFRKPAPPKTGASNGTYKKPPAPAQEFRDVDF